MSFRPQRPGPVPEETARVARAAFPKGSPSLRMRDDLGVLYEDSAFAPLFPVRGQPAIAHRVGGEDREQRRHQALEGAYRADQLIQRLRCDQPVA
jgi:hypothetical protein